jgi:hypothetical protein
VRSGRLRWVVAGLLVVAVVAGVVVGWPAWRSYTGVAPPQQFYDKDTPDPALATAYPRVLGVAHNAGNNLGTIATALRYHADVIEIDVISARGRLSAGREQSWPWLGRLLFRGPSLATAWDHAAAAATVKLDLKETDRGFLDDLIAFLTPRVGSRRVMISSDDAQALIYLHDRLPGPTLLFSVNNPAALDQLKLNVGLQQDIGGVSAFQGLIDPDLVRWAHDRKLLIVAWTVNDGQRFNQLVRLGVDGITTANLAILQTLAAKPS